jgi:hypothetical protein
LQVETMRASAMPGSARSEASARGMRSASNTMRSRTSIGAVR